MSLWKLSARRGTRKLIGCTMLPVTLYARAIWLADEHRQLLPVFSPPGSPPSLLSAPAATPTHLVLIRVERPPRHKRQAPLRLRALVFRQVVQLVILQLVVADVAVALAGEEADVVVRPEGHDDAGGGVQDNLLWRSGA